jgi:hypothetical membrane protein
MMEKIAPLTGGFLIISIVGFFLSLFLVYNKGQESLGVAFMLVFIAMFIASFISLHNTELETMTRLDKELKKQKKPKN